VTVFGLVVLAGLVGITALCRRNLAVFRLAPAASANPPPVSVLIPARNEAAEIEGAVRAACAPASRISMSPRPPA
jgi:cellulose synthase/poly-beta-1,6-N-acetylglucosamine synthase-like glycosyltransferase